MKAKLLLVAVTALAATLAGAQTADKQKVDSFATAVAQAEGFGLRRAIPTRYHNPGDLKSRPGLTKLPGQKGLGKGGHIVFRSDADGWDALHDLISKMVDGRSRHFNPDMTIVQVAKVYAANWRPWVKIVCKELGVPPSTRLRELLMPDDAEPPEVHMASAPLPDAVLSAPTVLPTLARD